MDSGSGKHRRRSSKSRHGGPGGPHRRKHSSLPSRRAPTQSFAPPPAPSRGTIRFPQSKRETPRYKVFLAGFIGVFILVLMGGSHHAAALGMALVLPGLALLLRPPTRGLGKMADWGALALLGVLLLAFLPAFYWPTAEWREVAETSFGIELPASLSVRPWMSLEAWFMALGGFAWLYAASDWRTNFAGRRWLFFYLSIALSLLAAIVIWGNLVGERYLGAEDATAFSFFPNRNQTANFLALGGVATFAYAMEGLRHRILLPLVGVIASSLCLAALVLGVSRAGVLLYFLGVVLWFVGSLKAHSLPRFFKVGFPVVVVAFSVVISSNERTVERILHFASPESELGDEFRLKIYEDTARMVLDAPVAGFGLGTFSAVFPQYREASANYQRVVHPESDLFWLASEGGVLAVAAFGLFLFGCVGRCRGISSGASGGFRVFAAVVVVLFLVHGLVDVPGHRPGTVYFAILFLALAFPRSDGAKSGLRPVFWRGLGGLLTLVGMLWIFAGCFQLPLHSSIRLARYEKEIQAHVAVADFTRAKSILGDWLELRPLDWRAYFQRAQLTLSESGHRSEAAADFRRARFVEPILGVVSYEEGQVWLPYDHARAVAAWRATLFREMDSMDDTYERMLKQARKSPDLMERMARLSEMDPHYRTVFLHALRGEELMRELRIDLSRDPDLAQFTREQRTELLAHWIKRGDLDSAEAFLSEHADSLDGAWWLWSLLLKDRADFRQAVEHLRENVERPRIPEVELDEVMLARLTREHAVAPRDVMKGTALLYYYVERQAYEKALPIVDRILEAHNPPAYLYYWRAECLYQLEEYIESWYTFENYLNVIKGEKD